MARNMPRTGPSSAELHGRVKAIIASGAKSKATMSNPKDLFGLQKISFTKVSAIAMAHFAMAMMDGARKYGPYNWRDKPVIASIYIDAAQRHLLAWFEGEELADDSHAHHLGHAGACCAILLDAQEHGVLIDDRPNGKGLLSKLMKRLAVQLKAESEARAAYAKKSTKRKTR